MVFRKINYHAYVQSPARAASKTIEGRQKIHFVQPWTSEII